MGCFDDFAATDEDVAILGGNDWPELVRAPVLAIGRDGACAELTPWVLTSASNDFESQGVEASHVCHVELGQAGDATQPYPNAVLAVVSTSAGSCTLKPIGMTSGLGIGPGHLGDVSSIRFRVATACPVIERVDAQVRRDLRIIADTQLFSSDDLKRVVCYGVLRDLCRDRARMIAAEEDDHWAKKAKAWEDAYDKEMERLKTLYGPTPAARGPGVGGAMTEDLTTSPTLWWRDDE